MKYNRLGSSDLVVSEVCLGSMTWGRQNTEEEAHAQIEYAIQHGVNFIDTAELYPVPGRADGHIPGRTEEILGSYLGKHPDVRKKLIIATKIVGHIDDNTTNSTTNVLSYRTQPPTFPPPDVHHLTAQSIQTACRASLRRLQTDYIDLYQIHWPERYVPLFGKREYRPEEEWGGCVSIRETLLGVKQLLEEGVIRAYGLSNETTFGVCQYVRIADELGMPRPATIQNSFCLLDRRFETELAEACCPSNYNIGLLPWSILAGGTLTGKYGVGDGGKEEERGLGEALKKSRFTIYETYQARFFTDRVRQAAQDYAKIAKRHGMSAATLAQAFCKSRWYIPSSIIGATTMEQLKENIDAFDLELSVRVLKEIDQLYYQSKDCIVEG